MTSQVSVMVLPMLKPPWIMPPLGRRPLIVTSTPL